MKTLNSSCVAADGSAVSCWNTAVPGGDEANLISGSDGYNFGPSLNKSLPLEIFVDTIYRQAFCPHIYTFSSSSHQSIIKLVASFSLFPLPIYFFVI